MFFFLLYQLEEFAMSKPEEFDHEKEINDALQAFLDAEPDLELLDRAVEKEGLGGDVYQTVRAAWEAKLNEIIEREMKEPNRSNESSSRAFLVSDDLMMRIFKRGIKQEEIAEVYLRHFEISNAAYQYFTYSKTDILIIIAETLSDQAEKAVSLIKGRAERRYQYLKLVVIPGLTKPKEKGYFGI